MNSKTAYAPQNQKYDPQKRNDKSQTKSYDPQKDQFLKRVIVCDYEKVSPNNLWYDEK